METTKKVIIIGAGIGGISLARLFAEINYEVDIYEQNDFIGGNCYDYYNKDGILIHKFGPHIFHTNYENVWTFLNKFSKFNNFINQVLVKVDDQFVQMPINLHSIKQLYPNEYDHFINEIKQLNLENKYLSISELLALLKDKANQAIINQIYQKVFVSYSTKMWGTTIDKLDENIIKRVKIALNFDWNYFPNDKYYGLPTDGYSQMFAKMINHQNIKLHLNQKVNNIQFIDHNVYIDNKLYDYVIYTGSIDELFNYQFDMLAYRSLYFDFKTYNLNYYQPVGVVNYPQAKDFTRITEYKHLTKQTNIKDKTTISYEYPNWYDPNSLKWNIRFYPINDQINSDRYQKYLELAKSYNNLYLIGRLAQYKYFDMDDIVYEAIKLFEQITKKQI